MKRLTNESGVIDVEARELKAAPKFLTGVPNWMDNKVGRIVLALYAAGMVVYLVRTHFFS